MDKTMSKILKYSHKRVTNSDIDCFDRYQLAIFCCVCSTNGPFFFNG